MSSYITSPNMGLSIPVVGQEAGPQYATDVNNSLSAIDSHSHQPGSGVYITPLAININQSLAFNNNFATGVAGITLQTQTATPAAQTLYVQAGTESTPRQDLFYNDGTTVVQLTSGGAVNATAANIPGESYAGGTFTWRQGTGSTVPANFDLGSVTVRPNTASTTYGVNITPPLSISSTFNVALPNLPVTNPAFVTIDVSGNMSATVSTVGGITSSNIASGTITSSNIASATITGGNIAAATITASNLAPGSVYMSSQEFTSSGTFTVPAGVNFMSAYMFGGGGGGGGAAGGGSGFSGAGGGGGGGSCPQWFNFSVTPGSTLNITVGSFGVGGNGGTDLAGGTAGTAGGTSSISIGGNTLYNAYGGAGGLQSNFGGGIGAGGAGSPLVYLSAGGGGTLGSGSTLPGGTGQTNTIAYGGAGGTSTGGGNNGGGGGGGGAGSAAGGPGGNGGVGTTPGQAGTVGGGYGSGGGGGGGGQAGYAGGAGGNGGAGVVILYWLNV